MIDILVDLHALKISDQSAAVFYFSKAGHINASDIYYEAGLSESVLVRFSSDAFNDSASIKLVNNGSYDYLRDYSFNGRQILIQAYDSSTDVYSVLFIGTLESVQVRNKSVDIKINNHFDVFHRPIVDQTFAGDNVGPSGLEGNEELKGTLKPRLFGKRFNVSPILVNPSLLVYGCNWSQNGLRRAITSDFTVRDKGVPLTFYADYAAAGLLMAATIPASNYGTCIADGLIMLGSAPAGDITMDPTDAICQNLSGYVSIMAGENADLFTQTAGVLSVPSYMIGKWVTGEDTYLDVYREVVDGLDLTQFFANNGDFIVYGIDKDRTPVANFVDNQSTLELNDVPVLELDAVRTELPPSKVSFNYKFNHTQQDENSLAGSVTDIERWRKEWQTVETATLSVNDTLYPVSDIAVINSALYEETDAIAAAYNYYDERNGIADIFSLKVPLLTQADGGLIGVLPDVSSNDVPRADSTTAYTADSSTAFTADATAFSVFGELILGQNINIISDRFGLDGSQNYSIMEYILDTGKMSVNYTVRGLR